MNGNNIVELEHITKVFPNVIANDDICLQVREGEIHSIAGENGAGKSTLMNILYGMYQPDRGIIRLRGKETRISSPSDSIALGIGMVHQHFMLIPKLTVAQNIILGLETGTKFKLDYSKAVEEVGKLSEQYGMNIEPEAKVSDISVPMQQRVEILKVLYRKAEILIFDEPTAVLTPQEIVEFCRIMERLRVQGKTIIFISHKLAEVMKVSDRISVMRRGQIKGTLDVSETDEKDLAVRMVGHAISLGGGERTNVKDRGVLLDITNLTCKEHGVTRLDKLNLSVRRGEILGVAGVDGNGQEELVDTICGKMTPESGKLEFMGRNISGKSVRDIKKMGLGVIYEDRHKDGLVLPYTVQQNLMLGYQDEKRFLKHGIFIDYDRLQKNAIRLQEEFDIRCGSLDAPTSTLSGGNQQKIILAREMDANPELVMAVQPTRGLDLGAIEFVHQKLVDVRNKGKGILLLSLELDEILQLSDRIAVIFKGKIVKVLENKGLTKEELGMYMLGIGEETAHGENE